LAQRPAALLAALILGGSVSISAGTTGASTYVSPKCNLGTDDSTTYKFGEKLKLCVFLSTSPVRKMIFEVEVDQYATMMLRGSQMRAAKEGRPVYTWVTSSTQHLEAKLQGDEATPLDCSTELDFKKRGNFVSCPQKYTDSDHTAVLMSLVVNLKDGKMAGFAWDNACTNCGPQRCMDISTSFDLNGTMGGRQESYEKFGIGVCGTAMAKCDQSKKSQCDMVVLVTWAGTDRDGRNLLTAGMRLSKFSGHTMKSMYETMDDHYDTIR
jgi:hypothetical protein